MQGREMRVRYIKRPEQGEPAPCVAGRIREEHGSRERQVVEMGSASKRIKTPWTSAGTCTAKIAGKRISQRHPKRVEKHWL